MRGPLAALALLVPAGLVTAPVAAAQPAGDGGASADGGLLGFVDALLQLGDDDLDDDDDRDEDDEDDDDRRPARPSAPPVRPTAPPALPPRPPAPPPDGPAAAPAPAPAPVPAPAPPAAGAEGVPAPPAVRAPLPPGLRRLVSAAHLVRPARGAAVGVRPVLRWRDGRRGVRLYNVQVFTADGRPRKVLSVFPRGRAVRLPAGALQPGRRYLWRVWPYLASGRYTARPLAVSWFATRPAPPSPR